MPKQNTKPVDYPQAVVQQIELLAQNIVIARKRRKETQAQWAKKLGVSQPTMARIERGDPAVSMATYAMCIWLIKPGAALSDLIAPQHDNIALEREIAKVRPRRAAVAASSPRKRDEGAVDKHVDSGSGKNIAEVPSEVNLGSIAKAVQMQEQRGKAENAQHVNAGMQAEVKRIRDQTTAAEIAKSMGMGVRSAQAAGLAALISKAQGDAQ